MLKRSSQSASDIRRSSDGHERLDLAGFHGGQAFEHINEVPAGMERVVPAAVRAMFRGTKPLLLIARSVFLRCDLTPREAAASRGVVLPASSSTTFWARPRRVVFAKR